MRLREAPCKNCTERYLGCHDKCEVFKEYRGIIDIRKENICKHYETDNELYRHYKELKQKMKKR